MHKFHCAELDFKICISQSIVDELFSHRQTHCFSKESGGMLFSNNLNDSEIEINKITTPGSTDLRKRNYFKLDEKKAKEEAERLLQESNAKIENTIRTIKEAQAEKERTRTARQELTDFKQQVENLENRDK